MQMPVYNPAVRILLLNLYYPPDTSATAKMAETVVNALPPGNEVMILCGRPSYDQTEQSGHVRIIRLGSTEFPRMRMKRRVLNYLSYTALVVPGALFTPCDAVL